MVHYRTRTASEVLPFILQDLLSLDADVASRNGRVKELLNPQIVLTSPTRREILNPSRKANVFAQIAETCWVLSGRNDVEWLSAYLPRAFDYADDGAHWRAGYGPRLRNFNGINQLERVVDALKKDPLTRQAVIQIWDVSDGDTELSLLDRACNTQLQFLNRFGYLHLTVTVRSNDVMWGWSGINAFEWSVLQEIVASLLNVYVGHLTFNIGSLHLYDVHWKRAAEIVDDPPLLELAPFPTPQFNSDHRITSLEGVDNLLDQWFQWESLCRVGRPDPTLLRRWQEPLFESWAAAIAYYWTRDNKWITGLRGTALGAAVACTPASVLPEPVQSSHSGPVAPTPASHLSEPTRAFYGFVSDLHSEKHASYGNSWKKRGEKLSILANIARKVDRLGVGDKYDSSADTVIDLLVYLIKYECWLQCLGDGPGPVNAKLWALLERVESASTDGQALDITFTDVAHDFDHYADHVDTCTNEQKLELVASLMETVAPIARDLWLKENNDEYRGADID